MSRIQPFGGLTTMAKPEITKPADTAGKKAAVTFVIAPNGKVSSKGQSLQFEPVKALKDSDGSTVTVPMSTVPGGGPTLILYLRPDYFRKYGIEVESTGLFSVTIEPVTADKL